MRSHSSLSGKTAWWLHTTRTYYANEVSRVICLICTKDYRNGCDAPITKMRKNCSCEFSVSFFVFWISNENEIIRSFWMAAIRDVYKHVCVCNTHQQFSTSFLHSFPLCNCEWTTDDGMYSGSIEQQISTKHPIRSPTHTLTHGAWCHDAAAHKYYLV